MKTYTIYVWASVPLQLMECYAQVGEPMMEDVRTAKYVKRVYSVDTKERIVFVGTGSELAIPILIEVATSFKNGKWLNYFMRGTYNERSKRNVVE